VSSRSRAGSTFKEERSRVQILALYMQYEASPPRGYIPHAPSKSQRYARRSTGTVSTDNVADRDGDQGASPKRARYTTIRNKE